MRNRLFSAFGLAFAGIITTTGVSSAAFIESKEEVMYATGVVIVVLLVLASIGAGVKHAFGLDKMPPPDPADAHGSHGGGHH